MALPSRRQPTRLLDATLKLEVPRYPVNCTEKDVGIDLFFNDAPGFAALFKYRFSDFVVEEIGKDGAVAEYEETKDVPCHPSQCEEPPLDLAALRERACALLGKDETARLLEVVDLDQAEFITQTPLDKASRTELHALVRRALPSFCSTAVPDQGLVRIFKGKPKRRIAWGNKPYLRFCLSKQNRDFMSGIQEMARALRVPGNVFSFAGSKDKRGATTQWVTAKRVEARRLFSATKRLRSVRACQFSYVADPLRLGDLRGNRFKLVLRELRKDVPDSQQPRPAKRARVDPPPLRECVSSACAALERGFVNYYGLQRFGRGSVPTTAVGAALLASEYKRAVALLLAPREGEGPVETAARLKLKETRDIASALKEFPRWLTAERALLNAYMKVSPANHVGALQRLPRTLRKLYVHSVQSLVWNRMASARLRLGRAVLPGDLVKRGEDEVQVVRAGEEAQFSLFDVVLPLSGYSVLYPEHEVNEAFMWRILEELDLKPSETERKTFWENKTFPDLSSKGAYRALLGRVDALRWELIGYSHSTAALQATPFEQPAEDVCVLEGEAPRVGLRIQFSLAPGTYATMALRELTKRSTGYVEQRKLVHDLGLEHTKPGLEQQKGGPDVKAKAQ